MIFHIVDRHNGIRIPFLGLMDLGMDLYAIKYWSHDNFTSRVY